MFKQLLIATLCAIVSLFLETIAQADAIALFIKEQGLILLAALFTLNLTGIVFILSRFDALEQKYQIPGFFKEARESISANPIEFISVSIAFYIILAIAPNSTWGAPIPPLQHLTPGMICHESARLVSRFFSSDFYKCYPLILAIGARVCLYHVLTITYDIVKATITSSKNPDPTPPQSS